MFDQVLNEVFVISVVFILIPALVIAGILLFAGRRRNNR
jgi:hypothetical protein